MEEKANPIDWDCSRLYTQLPSDEDCGTETTVRAPTKHDTTAHTECSLPQQHLASTPKGPFRDHINNTVYDGCHLSCDNSCAIIQKKFMYTLIFPCNLYSAVPFN